jgi:type I restriction enzyme S subunit
MHLSLEDLRYTGMSLDEIESKDGLARPGDLLFTRYNGNRDLVGACARVPDHSPTLAYPDKLIRVTVPANEVDSRYIAYTWASSEVQTQVRSHVKTTAGQTGISGISLKSIRLPVPPMAEQRRIARLLGSVDSLRARRRKAMALLDDLTESLFLEMFGDPQYNPMDWPTTTLGSISDIQGGLQVSAVRRKHPIAIPYLRVANVHRNRLDLDEVKELQASQAEISRTCLKAYDLLIVEGHGNSEEIGRGAIWDGSIDPCTHQNHLIRVRLEKERAAPVYIGSLLNSTGGRRHLLRAARTTSGLNSISVSNVKSTPIILPPIGLQDAFAMRVSRIAQLRESHISQLAELDALFASLQHRAFCGMLWDSHAA